MGEVVKLAFFVDSIYRRDDTGYSCDEAFILFPISFRTVFEEIILIGRLAPQPGRMPYALPMPAVTLCPLPYYKSVYDLWKDERQIRRHVRKIVEDHAHAWDVVFICGPHPLGQYIAECCIKLGRPVVFVVRQNLVAQVRYRSQGVKRIMALGMATWLEWRFRQLARNRTVFAVGQEMATAYRAVTPYVHNYFICLIDEAMTRALSTVTPSAATDRLLFVGRLAGEKGLPYLFEALVQLRARGKSYSLDVIGSGPLEEALRAQVVAHGLVDQVKFHGYIAFGEALLDYYQAATALVVPSLSEGFPQVINEALTAGLPVIASSVGGIPAFIKHRTSGMLVPPADVDALASAIEELLDTPCLRNELRQNGQALMRDNTLDANRNRMMEVIRHEVLHETKASQAI